MIKLTQDALRPDLLSRGELVFLHYIEGVFGNFAPRVGPGREEQVTKVASFLQIIYQSIKPVIDRDRFLGSGVRRAGRRESKTKEKSKERNTCFYSIQRPEAPSQPSFSFPLFSGYGRGQAGS